MTRELFVRAVGITVGLVVVSLLAVPADAQLMRGIRGRVVDENGQPVADARVQLVYAGEARASVTYETKTGGNGTWLYATIAQPYTGTWNLIITKDDMNATLGGVPAELGGQTDVGDIVLRAGGPPPSVAAAGMSAEEREAENAERARLNALAGDANADIDAGNFDAAITKINSLIAEIEECAPCYVLLGDAQRRKGDNNASEQAYLRAIELDAERGEAYEGLATLYNTLGRFEEAGRMNERATELLGGGAGGTDPVAEYNQGIILWNQGRTADAKPHFERARELDPSMANAHFYYGLALVSEGDLAGAKEPFETYLKLAPTGENAETAKGLLEMPEMP